MSSTRRLRGSAAGGAIALAASMAGSPASAQRFEGSHPRLTSIVGRVADSLSDLGI